MSALRKALKVPNPDHGLYPKTFDNINGEWSAGSDYTLGALADSFYEYLLKIWALDGQMKPEFYNHWKTSEHAILKHLLKVENGHTFLASGHLEHLSSSQEHLTCFAGGLFGLSAKYAEKEESVKLLDIAERLTETCYRTYEKQRIGLAAEETSMKTMRAVQTKYILRPEVVESLFYMWRLTHKRKYRVWGAKIALAIELNCRTESGYVGLKDVEDLSAGYVDKQESFFLSETLKYLYLLFSEDSLISLDEYIFSTEAHPFRPLVRM
jgi:mannosyl-oligosaccharide alpha-1,2-mannosidase